MHSSLLVPLSFFLVYSSLFLPFLTHLHVLYFHSPSPPLYSQNYRSIAMIYICPDALAFADVLQSQAYLLFFSQLGRFPMLNRPVPPSKQGHKDVDAVVVSGTLLKEENCVHVAGCFHGYCFIVGPFFLDTTTTMCVASDTNFDSCFGYYTYFNSFHGCCF